jgi:NAD dependent epimerase/dehydratase
LKNRRVLVTGSSGFIGSHLVEELVKLGASVRALVHYNSRNDWGLIELLPREIRKELEVVSGDVQDPFMMRSVVHGCETVFHLAALVGIPYSYVSPASYVSTNTRGTLNVLQACLDEGVEKVVHTSTSEVYGTAQYVPIDERHPLQGQSPYSASKIGADKIVESYHLSFGLPVATIRPFNAYGPRQSARAIIPTIISQVLSGSEVRLGLLTPVRDLTYVKDTVHGFVRVAESDNTVGETVNIGTGLGCTIQELVDAIAKLVGKDVKIVCDEQRVRPERSEVMALICDRRRACELVQWQPRYALEEGLNETIAWIGENIGRYKLGMYHV